MVTNCKNCGAPLKSGKCEYCNTEHGDSPRPTVYFHDGDIIHDLVMRSILTPNEARKILGLEEK